MFKTFIIYALKINKCDTLKYFLFYLSDQKPNRDKNEEEKPSFFFLEKILKSTRFFLKGLKIDSFFLEGIEKSTLFFLEGIEKLN